MRMRRYLSDCSRGTAMTEWEAAGPRAERVWVVGIDGAVFRVIDALVAQGWMPNLGRLMREGMAASLLSTLPPISAPAWVSFQTGCNPGRHGVYSFRGPMRGSWERPLCNAQTIRVPRLWQYLELFGLSSGVINVPETYPVAPLPGYLVAGMLSPDGRQAVAYPAPVQEMLRAEGYVVDLHIGRHEREARTEAQIISLADDLVAVVRGRTRAALKLLETRPTDFFAIVYVATDRLQHHAWHQIERLIAEPEIAARDEACRHVLAVYQAVDQALGEFMARRDEDTAILVLSDHGFCGLHTRVYLNEWMAQRGWLRFKRAAHSVRQEAKRTRDLLKRILPRWLLLWGRRKLKVTHTMEWSETQAYAGDASENAIRINVIDREPAGTVERGAAYDDLRSTIIEALRQMRDPRSGEPVVERAHAREAIYSGDALDTAPDIVIEPVDGYELTPEVAYEGEIFVDARAEGRGIHVRPGVLVAAGPGIRSSAGRGQAEIIDVAPTVMHLLGLPVPSEMDGRVIEALLRPDWLAARPPRPEPMAGQVEGGDRSAPSRYTAEEQEMLEERLSNLGYLE